MRGVAWVLLFCAVPASASTAYAQTADESISISDNKAVKPDDQGGASSSARVRVGLSTFHL